MAFKMKNPSIAKMVKAAGDNRVAMKMKAESAMKMKEAAMKLERDAAMKKYVSDAQRKAVHASKAESAMKAAKPDYIDIDGDGNKTESMKQAAADKKSGMKMKKESKYGKKHDKLRFKGHKARDKATDAFDAGKERKADRLDKRADKKLGKARDIRVKSAEKESPAKMGHSPKKMKKDSAMKLKTFERKSGDLTQSEEARRRDRGEGRNRKQDRRNFYNEKKTRRKVEKSRKADAKARTAMAEFEAKAPKTKAAQDAMSKKDAKKVGKLGKKAAKAEQKARVKEAVASRQLSKQGSDPNRPEVKTRMGKGLDVDVKLPGRSNVAKGQRKFGTKAAGNIGRRKSTSDKGGVSVKVVDKERRDNAATRQARKAYRQKTGLRGAVNVRRKAKGKDAI
jgi:hypothetical protein